jgi:hypothetical protein
MRTDVMKLDIDKKNIYEVPLEWYDLKQYEEQLKQVLLPLLNKCDNMSEAIKGIYRMHADGKIPTFYADIPLQRPEFSDLFLRVNSLIENCYEGDKVDHVLRGKIQILSGMLKNRIGHDEYVKIVNELILNTVLLETKNNKVVSYSSSI